MWSSLIVVFFKSNHEIGPGISSRDIFIFKIQDGKNAMEIWHDGYFF